MQGITDVPRSHLTTAQVTNILQGSGTLTVDQGIETIDMNLCTLLDFSSDLETCQVARNSFDVLHASCTLTTSKSDLNFENVIARPYMTLTADGVSARFNMGAFFLASPRRMYETLPPVYDVIGYDILTLLNDPVGETYSVNAGANYLDAVETILINRGYKKYSIDKAATASVLPSAKVWAIDDRTTWITVVNDLLGAIGYAGVWSDWNGQLRIAPYMTPSSRGSEWTYDSSTSTSMVLPQRLIEADFFDSPNRWVAVRSNSTDDVTPVEGNGIFTYNNVGTGRTSQVDRGRVITKVFSIDAADQASLVASAQVTIDADMAENNHFEVSTSPNPLHWHFDRLTVNDDALGQGIQAMSTEWTLPFDGSDMTHKWSILI